MGLQRSNSNHVDTVQRQTRQKNFPSFKASSLLILTESTRQRNSSFRPNEPSCLKTCLRLRFLEIMPDGKSAVKQRSAVTVFRRVNVT